MLESDIFLRLLLTVVFGAILGLETETRVSQGKSKATIIKEEKQRIGGIRTYTILSLIGGIAGVLHLQGISPLVYLIFSSIILLVLAAYVLNVQMQHAFGLTTEIAILISFLIGFLTTSGIVPISVSLFILVILAFFLSQKRGIGKFIERVKHRELIDIFKFGLVSAVVLPLLPNQVIRISDLLQWLNLSQLQDVLNADIANLSLINPFRIWFVVVVVSGINLAGYMLQKFLGERKILFATSVIGGLISSTSTITSFAAATKTSPDTSKKYAGAALIANGVSFLSTMTLISVLNFAFLKEIYLVLFGFLFISISTGAFLILTSKKSPSNEFISLRESEFKLSPALKFVSLIVVITFLIQLLRLVSTETISVGVTALSGFTGLDPATIAISELLNSSTISLKLATVILLATSAINFLSKVGFSFFLGSRSFTKYLVGGLLLTLLANFLILV